MFSFGKKKNTKTNIEDIQISLFNYPEKETLYQVMKTVDETDHAVNVKIICTLTKETLADRKDGKWEVNWYAEGLEANLNYNLMQFKLA